MKTETPTETPKNVDGAEVSIEHHSGGSIEERTEWKKQWNGQSVRETTRILRNKAGRIMHEQTTRHH